MARRRGTGISKTMRDQMRLGRSQADVDAENQRAREQRQRDAQLRRADAERKRRERAVARTLIPRNAPVPPELLATVPPTGVFILSHNGVVHMFENGVERPKRVGDVDLAGRVYNGKHWVWPKGNPHSWRPGMSGNPGGRPKRRSFSEDAYDILMADLDETDRTELAKLLRVEIDDLGKVDTQRFIAAVMVSRAKRGDMDAFREIFDRRDPKPRRVEISGRGGAPIAAAIAAGRLSETEAADVYRSLIEGGEEGATGIEEAAS